MRHNFLIKNWLHGRTTWAFCCLLLFLTFLNLAGCKSDYKPSKMVESNTVPATAIRKDDNVSMKNPTAQRFERASSDLALGTSKVRSRGNYEVGNIGDFLSRIWALFGPPDSVGFEGFSYTFRDKETGLVFTAYSAGSGPSYGGFRQDASKLEPVLDAFDEILANTKPADCEIEYETDFGPYRSGARDGIPFDEPASK